MSRYRIAPQAKFWRRIRLSDVERYAASSGATEVHVRGQASPALVSGDHVEALDRYFAEQASS